MKLFKNIVLAALAIVALTSCNAQKAPKFDAKEYAERKTDRIDQVVDLTDAQQKEIYNLFLEHGKQIKKNIKEFKKECGEVKCPDGKRAKCDKPAECSECKAECKKADCKKADCDKKDCKKAECKKAECDKAGKCDKVKCEQKAECQGEATACQAKAECKKAECDKKECKKAECDKAAKCDKKECKKAECTKECKKAECNKAAKCDKKECKKAECDKKAGCDKAAKCDRTRKPHRHHHGINPEEVKALYGKVSAILTPEQIELLKAHRAQRFQCAPNAEQCCPSEK